MNYLQTIGEVGGMIALDLQSTGCRFDQVVPRALETTAMSSSSVCWLAPLECVVLSVASSFQTGWF